MIPLLYSTGGKKAAKNAIKCATRDVTIGATFYEGWNSNNFYAQRLNNNWGYSLAGSEDRQYLFP
jgi:hypothetical protein